MSYFLNNFLLLLSLSDQGAGKIMHLEKGENWGSRYIFSNSMLMMLMYTGFNGQFQSLMCMSSDMTQAGTLISLKIKNIADI